jgi:hypothetical protein
MDAALLRDQCPDFIGSDRVIDSLRDRRQLELRRVLSKNGQATSASAASGSASAASPPSSVG